MKNFPINTCIVITGRRRPYVNYEQEFVNENFTVSLLPKMLRTLRRSRASGTSKQESLA